MSSLPPDGLSTTSLPTQPENAYLRLERVTPGSVITITDLNSYFQRQSTLSFQTTLPGTPRDEVYADEKAGSLFSEQSDRDHEERVKTLGDLNTMVDEKSDFSDPDGMKVRRAKRLMKVRKSAFQFCIFGLK